MGGGETEDGTLGDHTMGGGPGIRSPDSYIHVCMCVYMYTIKKKIYIICTDPYLPRRPPSVRPIRP